MRIESIHSPQDLKKLTTDELVLLAQSVREFLLETLNETGGHLAAGLGTVELTLALHSVFNTPQDTLIWDVGHQAYPHKILTERRELMKTLRQKDGLAPFPRREESPYDAFGVGHSSTSISAALGMSLAKKHRGDNSQSIAVIGDGAMTAGMAFEALNHAGSIKADLLVILNDNDMSISGNVGALSNYFARILSSKVYTTVRTGGKHVLSRMPPVWEFARRTEEHIKGMIVPGTLFEEMGVNYIGPMDGHDLPTLCRTLQNIKNLKGPQLLHVITRKGKGYPPAERDPIKYHAVSKGFYNKSPAESKTKQKNLSFSDVFGQWLIDIAKINDRMIAITPAMCEGSGMVEFSKRYPHRYYDVGIAEQHSVTLAAGFACEKMKPVVAIYSTFLQRAYDQLVHDVALQNLPVLFALDRAGLVPDGPTHSGCFDFSFLRCIPNMVIMAPADGTECRNMLYTGLHVDGPATVRYPRGNSPHPINPELRLLPIGKAEIIKKGQGIALLSFGTMLEMALQAAEQLNATVINMRFVKPLDEKLILEIAQTHSCIATIEENVLKGGAGEGVLAVLAANHYRGDFMPFGIPDHFIEHASPSDMLADCGLSVKHIIECLAPKVSNHASNEVSSQLNLNDLPLKAAHET